MIRWVLLVGLLAVAGPALALQDDRCPDGTRRGVAIGALGGRPANGLPTLGTLLITGGGALVLGSFFTALLGTFGAFDLTEVPQQLIPALMVVNSLALILALLGIVVVGSGVTLYIWGWSLATPEC